MKQGKQKSEEIVARRDWGRGRREGDGHRGRKMRVRWECSVVAERTLERSGTRFVFLLPSFVRSLFPSLVTSRARPLRSLVGFEFTVSFIFGTLSAGKTITFS